MESLEEQLESLVFVPSEEDQEKLEEYTKLLPKFERYDRSIQECFKCFRKYQANVNQPGERLEELGTDLMSPNIAKEVKAVYMKWFRALRKMVGHLEDVHSELENEKLMSSNDNASVTSESTNGTSSIVNDISTPVNGTSPINGNNNDSANVNNVSLVDHDKTSKMVLQEVKTNGFPKYSGKGEEYADYAREVRQLIRYLPWTKLGIFKAIRLSLPAEDRDVLALYNTDDPDLNAVMEELDNRFANSTAKYRAVLERLAQLEAIDNSSPVSKWRKFVNALIEIKSLRNGIEKEKALQELVLKLPIGLQEKVWHGDQYDLDEVLQQVSQKERFIASRENALLERSQKVDQNRGRDDRRKGPKVNRTAIGPQKCAFHDAVGHLSENCTLPVEQRLEQTVKKNRCFGCLSPFTRGHFCRDRCTEPGCARKHHHALHGADFSNWRQYRETSNAAPHPLPVQPPVFMQPPVTTQPEYQTHVKQVVPSTFPTVPQGPAFRAMKASINSLPAGKSPTLRVAILNGKERYEANVFMDDGATHSGVWQGTVNMLDLPCQKIHHAHFSSFEGPSQVATDRITNLTIQALDGSHTVNWKMAVMPVMPEVEAPEPDLPIFELARSVDGTKLIIPDILIGSDRIPEIVPLLQHHEVIRSTNEITVYAHETTLGRFVSSVQHPGKNKAPRIRFNYVKVSPDCLTCQDTKSIFRDPLVESGKDEIQASYVDRYAEQSIEYRQAERRFYAIPPWLSEKRPESNLSIVRYVQMQCFRRLQKKGLLDIYTRAVNEFEENGYSVRLPESETSGYFLPHRPVFKEGSTTSVRPVFNGSFARFGQRSLNDLLFKGAWPQTNLHSTLVIWRLFEFSVFADVKKAFLQIRIPEADRQYFRYLWFDADGRMIAFEMTSLIFGATSSPFVLYAVLRKLFLEHAPPHLKSFTDTTYMDDALVVASSAEELKSKLQQIEKVLELGSFQLHKLVASFSTQRQLDPSGHYEWACRATESEIEDPPKAKVLGVYWNLKRDTITWPELGAPPEKFTRRIAASALAKLFDPLGLLGPFHLQRRAAMREAVFSTHNWDEPLAPQIHFELRSLLEQYKLLPRFDLPRWIGRNPNLTIHIFCDASKVGYGAAAYVLNRSGEQPAAFLLSSTARLWPKEDATMPRKELGAALIASIDRKSLHKITGASFRCFSDSQCNLARIQKGADSLAPYEAHRVCKILENTRANEWGYVNTKQNPADILSRGASLGQLLSSRISWFELKEMPSEPVRIRALILSPLLPSRDLESRLCESSFEKLLKAFELILSAMDRRFEYSHRVNSSLAQIAYDKTIALIQRAKLPLTYKRVLEKRPPHANEPIRLRNKPLLIDQSGVLRLDSRATEILEIEQDWITYEEMHRIVMPDHPITKSFVRYLHQGELFHSRRPRLEAYLRKYYDIKGVTILVRQVIDECLRCRRFHGGPYKTPMARLPIERVQPVRAFHRIGLDLFGPIHLPGDQKVYGMIFVCTTSRAIHLELVEDKSTESVKQALLRFIARRGMPAYINSDNEKSFRKLNWMLRSFFSILKQVRDVMVRESPIVWTFNSPHSPWEGGHYERLIRSVKAILSNFNPQTFRTFSDLSTILAQVEAFVNARPLCKLAGDDYLTPTHLLTGFAPTSLPEMRQFNPDVDNNSDLDLASRFRALERKVHALWMKWCQNYLTALPAWPEVNSREPRIGELVLERHPNKTRGEWQIGVITALRPNPKDQVVRHVDLKMLSDSSERRGRAVANLIPLEAEQINTH